MLEDKSILFTCAGFGGGISKMIRYVSSICTGEFKHVFLLHRGRESKNDVAPEGVQEIEVPVDFNENTPCWRWKQICGIRREIKRVHPDAVCCFGSEQALMVALAMIGLKDIKLIQCDRGDPYTLSKKWHILAKWAFRRADNCVFQLEKQGRWYGDKVMLCSAVIPNAFIPTGEVKPYKGKRNKTIVSVGRFSPEKQYEVLIDAFREVHTRHPEYRLILHGEGPSREKYNAMIAEYGLKDCVELPGYAYDAMNAIRNEGIFVLSSLREGIPNALIEALAMGIPTVSTDCTPGGPDFLTNHGRRGLIVPVNDSKAMATSICKIIENPDLAASLSNLGQEIIPLLEKEYISKLWLDFFKKVLN